MCAVPSAAVKALQLEMKNITKDPVEGVLIELQDQNNMFEWDVGVFGPPKTLYEGGYFKVRVMFTYLFTFKWTLKNKRFIHNFNKIVPAKTVGLAF